MIGGMHAPSERYVRPVAEIERHFSVEETISRYEELFALHAASAETSAEAPLVTAE